MKILIISSFLPYPLFTGGHIRLFNIIKELSKRHSITLICEKREYQTSSDIAQVEKVCKQVITFNRKKQWSLIHILKAAFSSYPFLMIGHTQPSMKEKISSMVKKEPFDVIHIETSYVMQNVPDISLPTVLVEHNIEYLVYERFTKNALFFFRPLFFLDIAKLKYWEEYFWKKATKLVSVSKQEAKYMGRTDIAVVPNGVDIGRFKIQDSRFKMTKKEKRILFIGDFKWIQNIDAIKWLLLEVWPIIRSKIKDQKLKIDIRLWVVGKKIPNEIKQLTYNKNVFFDENAPKDTVEIFNNSDILLAPIRVGGGTSYKILEAMASGTVVVTTPLGIEGIEAENNKEVLVGENSESLAQSVLDLLTNESIYKKISQNARALIEEKYDWKIIVKELEAVYNLAIKNS